MKNKPFDVPLIVLSGVFVLILGTFIISSSRQISSVYKNVASEVSSNEQLAQAGGGSGSYGDLSGWAWSSNIGWISFNSSDTGASGGPYAVNISTTTLSPSIGKFTGYAWSSNVGWISFNPGDITGCPNSELSYDTPASASGSGAPLPSGTSDYCTPRVDLSGSGTTGGVVSGWARILSMKDENGQGWLHLSGINHPSGSGGVHFDASSKSFTGYAWEPSSVGWVSFDLSLNSTFTPPPVSLTGGSCTVSPTTATVASGGSAQFTISYSLSGMSGGVGPYSVTTTLTPSFTVGIWPVTLGVRDSSTPANTTTLSCGSIEVKENTPATDLGIYLGATPATARLAPVSNPFGIRQGNKFAVKWDNNLVSGYSCSKSVVNTTSGAAVNFWNNWNSANVNNSGSIQNQTTASSNGVTKGIYKFTISCVDNVAPIDLPPRSVEGYLRVLGVSGEEF